MADADERTLTHASSVQIRNYKILRRIGQGGMGTVFKAVHADLDREVALKLLDSRLMQDPRAIERFRREMKAVGRLQHPNVVTAYDAGEENGTHFLVMELVEGHDIATVVQHCGRLRVADACEIVRQAALGLQHAHEHNLIHRDIKPANLILTTSGTVKILDFGLALLQNPHTESGAQLTGTGHVMGTVDYMAPEQVAGSHHVDIRADIYSLGATLYSLLTAAPVFSGEAYDTTLKKIMAVAHDEPPPIAEHRDDLPDELISVIDQMMAKAPDNRTALPQQVVTAIESHCVGNDLVALASEAPSKSIEQSQQLTHAMFPTEPGRLAVSPVTAMPDGSVPSEGAKQLRSSRFMLIAITAIIVLLAVVAYGIIRNPKPTEEELPPSEGPPVASNAPREEVEPLDAWPPRTFIVDHPDFHRMFPDGVDLQTEVIRSQTSSKYVIVRKFRVDESGALDTFTFLFHPTPKHFFVEREQHGIYHPYDPNSRVMFIPYHDGDSLPRSCDTHTAESVRNIIGGMATEHIRDVPTVQLSEAAKHQLKAHDPDSCRAMLREWIASQHAMRAAWIGIQNKGQVRMYPREEWLSSIAISSDGNRMLVNESPPKLLDLVTGEVLQTFPGDGTRPESVLFSIDDSHALVGEFGNRVALFDSETAKPIRYFSGHKSPVWSARFSPDEALIVSGSMDNTIRVWETATGNEIACLKGHEGEVRDAVFSPDGKIIVSVGADAILRLWSVGEKREIARLQQQPMKVTSVVFTPQGDRLVTSCDDGVVRVYDVEAKKKILELTGHFGWALRVIVSRDGKRAVSCGWDCTIRIWDLERGVQLRRLAGHQSQVWALAFSPGEQFLYSASMDKTIRKWKVSATMSR